MTGIVAGCCLGPAGLSRQGLINQIKRYGMECAVR